MEERKTEAYSSPLLLSDEEIRSLGVRDCDLEMYRRKHYQEKFGIDTWYEDLKQHTFKTSFVILHFNEGNALVEAHHKKPLNQEQEGLIKDLEKRIDDQLKSEFPNGAFVKLNTRSPKDVTVYDESEETARAIDEEIAKVKESDRNDNSDTIAFVKATNRLMRITNGAEAMQLLIRSQRIYEDLTKFLQFGEKLFDMKVILREWIDEVPEHPEGEFRSFVHKNKLNAVTQYFSFCYFQELAKNKDNVQKRIVTFFDSIKDKLSNHESYVIDFFVLSDRILIIELNPFHNGAGAGLFSWKENRGTFMNGPLEFRVVEKLTDNPKEILPTYWLKYMEANYKRVPKKKFFFF